MVLYQEYAIAVNETPLSYEERGWGEVPIHATGSLGFPRLPVVPLVLLLFAVA
jgi:hypothetical protein